MVKHRKRKRSLPKLRLVHYTCTQLNCWYTFPVYIQASEVGYLPCPKCGCSAEKLDMVGGSPESAIEFLKKALLAEQ